MKEPMFNVVITLFLHVMSTTRIVDDYVDDTTARLNELTLYVCNQGKHRVCTALIMAVKERQNTAQNDGMS
jgi:hypothetical protein